MEYYSALKIREFTGKWKKWNRMYNIKQENDLRNKKHIFSSYEQYMYTYK